MTSSCLLGKADYSARGVTDSAAELILTEPECLHLRIAEHPAITFAMTAGSR